MKVEIINKGVTVKCVDVWTVDNGNYFHIDTVEKRIRLSITLNTHNAVVLVSTPDDQLIGGHLTTIIIRSETIDVSNIAAIVEGVERYAAAFVIIGGPGDYRGSHP